jgi:hypothetical protein
VTSTTNSAFMDGPSSQCGAGRVACGTTCTDLGNDPANCGGKRCVQSSAGVAGCFPGCSSTADCARVGAGLSCLGVTSVNRMAVGVCAM